MKEIGVVTKTNSNTAIVQIKRATACGENCGHCSGGCKMTLRKVEATNHMGAKIGEVVRIELNDQSVLFAAFMVYMVPLIALFIGYSVGYSIWFKEIPAITTGLVLMILSFLCLKKVDKNLKKSSKYQSKITKIIS